MIDNKDLDAATGAPVVGPGDQRIGSLSRIYADPASDTSAWATVQTGLFGMHESFIPLMDATWDGTTVRVPFDKALVKDAPRIDTDTALDSVEASELEHYYGLDASSRGIPGGAPLREATRPDPAPTMPLDVPEPPPGAPTPPDGPLGSPEAPQERTTTPVPPIPPAAGLGVGAGVPGLIAPPPGTDLPPEETEPHRRD